MKVTDLLNELGGAKGPIAQVGLDASHEDWANMLAQHGFRPIGQGHHGQVYDNPKFDYVLKIFTSADTAYLYWAKACLGPLKGNPYVPVFRGKTVKLNSEASAVRLEKLSVHTLDQQKMAYKITRILIDAKREQRNWMDDPAVQTMDNQLIEAISYIQAGVQKYKFMLDVRGANVMDRNGQMVIIDPLA